MKNIIDLLLFIYIIYFLQTCACWNLVSISPISHSKASLDNRNSSETHFVHKVDLTKHWNNNVAFSLACLLSLSSPATIIHLSKRSFTPRNKKILILK